MYSAHTRFWHEWQIQIFKYKWLIGGLLIHILDPTDCPWVSEDGSSTSTSTFQFKVDRLQIIVVAKKYIYVSP